MSEDTKFTNVTVEGRVMYASVHEPRPNYGEDRDDPKSNKSFEIQVEVTPQTIKELTHLGLSEKVMNPQAGELQSRYKETDGVKYLRVKKAVKKDKDGNDVPTEVQVVGPDLLPFKELIGNGSTCRVDVLIATYKNKYGKNQTSAKLNAVQVVNHVKYEKPLPSGFKAVHTASGNSDFPDADALFKD